MIILTKNVITAHTCFVWRWLIAILVVCPIYYLGQPALASNPEPADPTSVGTKELNTASSNDDKNEVNADDNAKKLRRLAAEGDAESQYELGVALMIEAPLGSGENAAKSFDWFRKAAEQGLAVAQNELGRCYLNGEGVEINLAQAFEWFQKAATKGNVAAQNSVGDCYMRGWGVKNDPIQAVDWYRKAAEKGSVYAQFSLAICYKEGSGVEEDPVQAIKWCREAAEKRLAPAQLLLGTFYLDGTGTEKDPVQAVVWFKKASDPYSFIDISAMAVDPCGNLDLLYKPGGAQETAESCLGVCYEQGLGVEKDLVQAIYWYRKAAERGSASDQLNLGVHYENGEGVEKDIGQAIIWYRKAAKQGNARAHFNLGQLYIMGEGVIQDDRQACVHFLIAGALGESIASERIKIIREERLSAAGYEDAQQEAKDWMKKFKNAQQDSPAPGDGSVAVRPSEKLFGSGSGFVISADGYFLTCAHVIEGGTKIKVRFGDKTYTAQLIHADVNNDVALLKLDGADFRPLALSPSLPEMGDKVFTVGFPNPELQGSSAKYTDGVISSLFGIIDDVRTMQITVPIQGGNSGGPLVDAAGNVLGLVVAQLNAATVFEYTGTIPQNVNFAVKINYALPIVQSVPGLAKNLPQPRTATPDARPVADVQAATGLVFVYE